RWGGRHNRGNNTGRGASCRGTEDPRMSEAFLADVLVAIHVAYVSFVVLGMAAILLGTLLKWKWVRNPWFRVSHFVAIVIVALEAIFGIACPLTVWEDQLRRSAGQTVAGGTFVGRLLHRLRAACGPVCFPSLPGGGFSRSDPGRRASRCR